jgi:hypothetical protein
LLGAAARPVACGLSQPAELPSTPVRSEQVTSCSSCSFVTLSWLLLLLLLPSGEGWVSGTAAFPKECEGLTLRTCTRCANSKDPAKCRACANRSDLKFGLLQGLYAESPALADGCGLCVNSNQTNMCMACVAAGAPCADCALVGDVENPNFDPSACLLCTQKQGPGFVSPCLQCAHSGDIAGAVSECMSCLDTMAPLACNTTDPNQAPKLGCWDTSDPWSMGACGTCVRHPDTTHSGMCMACIHTSPYTNACQRCAVIKDECKQARCFQCVDASQHNPSSGCADCLESLWEPAKQQRCLACMSNPKLSTKAKESCYLCHERCWSPEAAASCVQCLETEQEDYNACFSSC